MTHRLRRLLAPVLAAALAVPAVAACGTEEPAAEAPPAPVAAGPAEASPAGEADGGTGADTTGDGAADPCKILTTEQVVRAMKVEKVEGARRDGKMCTYAAVPTFPLASLAVGVNAEADDEASLRDLMARAEASGYPAEEVAGLGDLAFYQTGLNTMHVVVGGDVYTVSALTEKPRDVVTRAARSVVESVS